MTITAEQLQDDFRYLFPDEVAALKELARSLPDSPVVVNLGAGSGTSGLAFMESRPDLILVTVDIEDGDSPFGSLYAEADVLRRAGFLDSLDRYRPIRGDSKLVTLQDGLLCEMCFIDAGHEYEECRADILAWLPRIKPGGIMAVHDFEKEKAYARPNLPAHIPHPLPWTGVDRAVHEFLLPFYDIVLHVDTLIAFRITDDHKPAAKPQD